MHRVKPAEGAALESIGSICELVREMHSLGVQGPIMFLLDSEHQPIEQKAKGPPAVLMLRAIADDCAQWGEIMEAAIVDSGAAGYVLACVATLWEHKLKRGEEVPDVVKLKRDEGTPYMVLTYHLQNNVAGVCRASLLPDGGLGPWEQAGTGLGECEISGGIADTLKNAKSRSPN